MPATSSTGRIWTSIFLHKAFWRGLRHRGRQQSHTRADCSGPTGNLGANPLTRPSVTLSPLRRGDVPALRLLAGTALTITITESASLYSDGCRQCFVRTSTNERCGFCRPALKKSATTRRNSFITPAAGKRIPLPIRSSGDSTASLGPFGRNGRRRAWNRDAAEAVRLIHIRTVCQNQTATLRLSMDYNGKGSNACAAERRLRPDIQVMVAALSDGSECLRRWKAIATRPREQHGRRARRGRRAG